MNHFILFIIVLVTIFGLNEAQYCPPNTIFIKNELGPGRVLGIHCRSQKVDLGVQKLDFNAPAYLISFWEDVSIVTRWNCILRQGFLFDYYVDVEVYKRDSLMCGLTRNWIAKLDGIYYAKSFGGPSKRVLSWKKR